VGILDGILGRAGGLGNLASMVASNPNILAAAASLLSAKDTSVGGSGGLGGVIRAFEGKGLGDVVSSWVGTGPNQPVSEGQITDVLGKDTLGQFASKAGISAASAGSVLSGLLPELVNHITPRGAAPEGEELEGALGSLLSKLGG
jgi:uncharacterized protein YidB (DUF937 family)